MNIPGIFNPVYYILMYMKGKFVLWVSKLDNNIGIFILCYFSNSFVDAGCNFRIIGFHFFPTIKNPDYFIKNWIKRFIPVKSINHVGTVAILTKNLVWIKSFSQSLDLLMHSSVKFDLREIVPFIRTMLTLLISGTGDPSFACV